jgi:prepilin-type N-terminal cleavage/methylation domain-containing protein
VISALRRRLWGEERGYSLIELVVVMTILGIVMGGLTTIFVSGGNAELDLNRRFQAQQQSRLALDRIRSDIHCASAAQSLAINTYPAVRLNLTSCSASTPYVYWCVVAVTTSPPRYQLYRTTATTAPTATTCTSTDASRTLVADYFTTSSNVFTTSTIPQYALQTVGIDFPASVNYQAGKDVYELKDSIVARNYSPRCATSGGCSVPAVP